MPTSLGRACSHRGHASAPGRSQSPVASIAVLTPERSQRSRQQFSIAASGLNVLTAQVDSFASSRSFGVTTMSLSENSADKRLRTAMDPMDIWGRIMLTHKRIRIRCIGRDGRRATMANEADQPTDQKVGSSNLFGRAREVYYLG
jgi:hypothetical protein